MQNYNKRSSPGVVWRSLYSLSYCLTFHAEIPHSCDIALPSYSRLFVSCALLPTLSPPPCSDIMLDNWQASIILLPGRAGMDKVLIITLINFRLDEINMSNKIKFYLSCKAIFSNRKGPKLNLLIALIKKDFSEH